MSTADDTLTALRGALGRPEDDPEWLARTGTAGAPVSLKDAPALIERLLPVQKLSAESFKEQEARQNKTLTALGSYWKGRKPLILNKACIIGCLLPAIAASAWPPRDGD